MRVLPRRLKDRAAVAWGYCGDGGAATNAELMNPTGVAVDAYGDLFISDPGTNTIRKVGTHGMITTFAGNGTGGYGGDGGPPANAELYYPSGVALDAAENLLIADEENQLQFVRIFWFDLV